MPVECKHAQIPNNQFALAFTYVYVYAWVAFLHIVLSISRTHTRGIL